MSITLDGTSGITTPALDSTAKFASADMPVGSVLQVVQTVKTDRWSASLAAGASAVVTGFDVTITPSTANNKVLVTFAITGNFNNASYTAQILQRNGVDLIVGDTGLTHRATSAGGSVSYSYLDSPNTTSAVTYRLSILNTLASALAMEVNTIGSGATVRGTGVSTITAMEIAG